MATIKDIAQLTGVNAATVSRALSGSKGVSEETRRKIIAQAHALNYVSNKREIAYTTEAMRTIGLVCPELRSEYYSEIVDAVQTRVRASGYSTILAVSNFSPEEEQEAVTVFGHKGVEGIMLVSTLPCDRLAWLDDFQKRTRVPVVLVCEGAMPALELDVLSIDTRAGVAQAMEHLFSLGHRDILFLGEELTRSRETAYAGIMAERFPEMQPRWLRTHTRFEEAGYDLVRELLASGQALPTAIFAAYDRIAVGAMRALQEAGIRVPEDVSIIGTDNIRITPYLSKALTTVSSPVIELGDIASKILFSKIANTAGEAVQRVQILPKLYVRETTAPPREG